MSTVNREAVNDTAKLVMHRLIARSVGRDPLRVERARHSLDVMARRFPDRSFIAEWGKLLQRPINEIRKLLISRDQDMARLRSSSPFMLAEGVDFTDESLRRRIGRAAKRIAARRQRSDS